MAHEESESKQCIEPSNFSKPTFMYYRASQSLNFDRKCLINEESAKFISTFETAFKPLTASESDAELMRDLYCYPCEATNYATSRVEFLREQLINKLKNRSDLDQTQQAILDDPTKLFRLEREDFIFKTVHEIIRKALLCQRAVTRQSLDRIWLWTGEKGCGKTTFANYIFNNNKTHFNDNNIIWIRTSVYHRKIQEQRLYDIEITFYAHVIKILLDHYRDREDFLSIPARAQIWKDRLEVIKDNHDDNVVLENCEMWEANKIEYAKRLMRYLYGKGWSFVLVIDNVDRIDDAPPNKDIINRCFDFAMSLTKDPVRSVVVLIARIETLLSNIELLADTYQNIDDSFQIPLPSFSEVFQRRLDYIESNLLSGKNYKTYNIRNKRVNVSQGYVAKHLAKYMLARNPIDRRQYLICALANDNLRHAFSMIISLMQTHITDVIAKPLEILDKIVEEQYYIPGEIDFSFDTIREHLVIWALCLKGNYLFYKNSPERTYLQNIYHVNNDQDSYFLKRILLDLFSHASQVANLAGLLTSQIYDVFCTEMLFDTEEVDEALSFLSSRKFQAPLLAKESLGKEAIYYLTHKGMLMGKWVANHFNYLELIIEDILVPKNVTSQYSVNIELIAYEPLRMQDPAARKSLARRYFLAKLSQLGRFLDFLECREILEKNRHNDFYCSSLGYLPKIFPEIRNSLNRQANNIASSLEINLQDGPF